MTAALSPTEAQALADVVLVTAFLSSSRDARRHDDTGIAAYALSADRPLPIMTGNLRDFPCSRQQVGS